MTLRLAQDLVQSVARAFYPDDYIVVLDCLCERRYILDSEKSGKSPLEEVFRCPPKQIRTILKDLHREGLIQQKELLYIDFHAALTVGKHLRKSRKIFWYINYRHFVQLASLRVSLMKKEIEKTLTNKLLTTSNAFTCPSCQKTYSMIDAQSNLDMETFKFKCIVCNSDLVETYQSNAKENKGKQKGLSLKRSLQLSTDKSLERIGVLDLLVRLKEISYNDLSENLPEVHLQEAEIRFRDLIARKKANNEIDGEELDRFLYQLETLKNENQQYVETDLTIEKSQDGLGSRIGDQSNSSNLNSLHSEINRMNVENGQSVLFKNQNRESKSLPMFFKRDLTGAVTQSALDDEAERNKLKVIKHLDNKSIRKQDDNIFIEDTEEYGGATDMLNFRKSLFPEDTKIQTKIENK